MNRRQRSHRRVREQSCDRVFGISYQCAYALVRHHDDAQDIAGETQARLWKTAKHRDDLGRLFTPGTDLFLGDRYVRQTTIHVAFDFLSRRKNEREAMNTLRSAYGIIDDEYRRPNSRKAAHEYEHEYELVNYERDQRSIRKRELLVEAAQNLVSDVQRRRMLYVLIDGLNYAQIAHLEGVSETAIRHTRDRAIPHMTVWIEQWALQGGDINENIDQNEDNTLPEI